MLKLNMHNGFTQSMSKFYNTVKHFHDLTIKV